MIRPGALARDGSGNLFVASRSNNRVFKVSGSTVETVVGPAGAGPGDTLSDPSALALDGSSNLYVAGRLSGNVLRVTPGGVVTEIIDAASNLAGPEHLVVDSLGRVYVTSASHGVFRVAPGGGITQVLSLTTLGANSFAGPGGLAVDSADNVYVSGTATNNVIVINPAGMATELLDAGDQMLNPTTLAVSGSDNLFIAVVGPVGGARVFRRSPSGLLREILTPAGDGSVPLLFVPHLAVTADGTAFVANANSISSQFTQFGGVFEVPPPPALPLEVVHGDLASGFYAARRLGTSLAVHNATLLMGTDDTSRSENFPAGTMDTSGPGRAFVYDIGQPTALLIVGDLPGESPFTGAGHTFRTLVGPTIEASWPVTPDALPAFALPARGGDDTATPRWMRDGRFVVQLLVWDPEGRPEQPELMSRALEVLVTADGRVLAEAFGTARGPVELHAEVIRNAAGRRVLRFPYSVH